MALSSRACPHGPTAAKWAVPALRVGGDLAVPETPEAPKGTRCPGQVEEDAGKGVPRPRRLEPAHKVEGETGNWGGRNRGPPNMSRSYSPHCESVSF